MPLIPAQFLGCGQLAEQILDGNEQPERAPQPYCHSLHLLPVLFLRSLAFTPFCPFFGWFLAGPANADCAAHDAQQNITQDGYDPCSCWKQRKQGLKISWGGSTSQDLRNLHRHTFSVGLSRHVLFCLVCK